LYSRRASGSDAMRGDQSKAANGRTGLIRSRMDVLMFALAALAIVIGAFSYGRHAQASAERSQNATIDEEDRYFCTGLGFIPTTALYQKCCAGASIIRNRQEERTRAKASPL
jgi:hypothetical protein